MLCTQGNFNTYMFISIHVGFFLPYLGLLFSCPKFETKWRHPAALVIPLLRVGVILCNLVWSYQGRTSCILLKIRLQTFNPSTNHFYITNLQGRMTDLEHVTIFASLKIELSSIWYITCLFSSWYPEKSYLMN